MAIHFTQQQEKVLQARNHNILVSAAAGSGKTAVLVERIVRMISEGEHPMDIDRLLVVTFTRAAAAQMRERIAAAISEKLQEDPGNLHLQRQETLLHNAQITTMDSFFSFLLRNNFSDIDLDPGFRLMDQTESDLLRKDAMEDFLEECYAQGDQDFIDCVDFFCPGSNDAKMADILDTLYRQAVSHPDPRQWLREREEDYNIHSAGELYSTGWMQFLIRSVCDGIADFVRSYDRMIELCRQPGGPEVYLSVLMQERECLADFIPESCGTPGTSSCASGYQRSWEHLQGMWSMKFGRLPACTVKKYPEMDESIKESVTSLRDSVKKSFSLIKNRFNGQTTDFILAQMQAMERPVRTLSSLAGRFLQYFYNAKKEKNAIDFVDLEHYALQVLAQKQEDGTYVPRRAAMAYRQYFDEILIDEYQDSNDVQELLLRMISGEDDGKYNRFMVGDVKQSIYKFRLARPEIFMEKFAAYRPDDPERELINLDRNFRSRAEVLASVNALFGRIMRMEIGGVEYDEEAALKVGADYYPEADRNGNYVLQDGRTDDPYRTEILLLDGTDSAGEGIPDAGSEIAALSGRKREALAVAQKIRTLVGKLQISGEDGKQRPCRYSDIVILLRSGAGWNEDFRDIFQMQGIPAYIDSKTGYFSAQEIRTVLQILRVLVNPRQDIPLYGAMHSYFGGFDEEMLARLRAESSDRDMDLYSVVSERAAREDDRDPLTLHCREFLEFIGLWRSRAQYMQVHELLGALLSETGYEDWCRTLPGGGQREANLHLLQAQADAFDKMSLTGLFSFIRYIDQMHRGEVDYGEANTLDENADVVRIMSIHRSKGLEFPVCIVAGMAKDYSYLHHDTGGSFLCDNDWGIGAKYWYAAGRTLYRTARQEAVVRKIRADSLGEELRILYVAMTRAREKLILTGYLSNARKRLGAWRLKAETEKDEKLSVSSLSDSTCYLQLLYMALEGVPSGSSLFSAGLVPCSSLFIGEAAAQTGMAHRRERLAAAGLINGMPLPDPGLAHRLQRRFSAKYARGNLKGLYTKTSVSELKTAAVSEILEDSDTIFPERKTETVIPSFARSHERKDERAISGAAGRVLTGTEYGTAFHRLLELFDYRRFADPASVTQAQLAAWEDELAAAGRIPQEYTRDPGAGPVLSFLHSPAARRMAAADASGRLFREQPFVLGIPADKLHKNFPHSETVLIQGIIDAFFVEDGQITVIDYKTDRVQHESVLRARYQLQLDYYAQALAQITGLPVREKLIYSTALEAEIRV